MRAIVGAIIILGAALPAAAQDKYVGGRYRLWQTDLEAEVRADDNGLTGTDIDFTEELDLDTDVRLDNVGFWAGIPMLGRVVVDYWWGTFDGEETLTRDLTFAGQTFTIGETVEASLDWRVLTLMLEYNVRLPLGSADTLAVRLGARIGAKIIFLDAELESSLAGKESAELKGGTPTLGAVAELYFLTYFSACFEIDGLKVAGFGSGLTGLVVDYSIVLRGGYMGFFVGAGFRSFRFGVEDDRTNVIEAEADVRIQGLFVEAGFRY